MITKRSSSGDKHGISNMKQAHKFQVLTKIDVGYLYHKLMMVMKKLRL